MRNKILMLAVIVFAACLILFAFLFFKNKQNIPITTDSTIPTNPTISLPTINSGVEISANNYYTDPTATIMSERDVVMETNESFDVLAYHYNNKRSFLIYLKTGGVSLEDIRQDAESNFIKKLGITKEQACSLLVTVALANDIKGSTTDNYGLSFCPNSKPLPFSD